MKLALQLCLKLNFHIARKAFILLILLTCGKLFSEARVTGNVSFGLGPETYLSFPLPNIQGNIYPFKEIDLYFGGNFGYLFSGAHAGIICGYSFQFVLFEVSTSGLLYQPIDQNGGGVYQTISVNPKVGFKLPLDELSTFFPRGSYAFIKMGNSVSLVRENNLEPPPRRLILFEERYPFNCEIGLGFIMF